MRISVSKKEFAKAIWTMVKTAKKAKSNDSAIFRWSRDSQILMIEFGDCGWELAGEGEWPGQVVVRRSSLEKAVIPDGADDQLELHADPLGILIGKEMVSGFAVQKRIPEMIVPGQAAALPLLQLSLTAMEKPPVYALCQQILARSGMGQTLWCQGGEWRLEFPLFTEAKRKFFYPVVLKCREKTNRIEVTATSRDVTRDPNLTFNLAVFLIQALGRIEPKSSCRVISSQNSLMIRYSFSYRTAWEKGDFESCFWKGLLELQRAMRKLFPMLRRLSAGIDREPKC
jgi:hypothetical protein